MADNKNHVNGHILTEQEELRYQKLQKLQNENYDAYGRIWERNFNCKSLEVKFKDKTKEELATLVEKLSNDQIQIAGRLMTKREMGKGSVFAHLQDQTGKFQIYLKPEYISQEKFNWFLEYADLGDFFGIKGKIMKTNKGELTVQVFDIVMLSKSIRTLPDKFHGLVDIEERYRRRYVDLIVSPDTKNTFLQRSKIITELRNFLNNKGYLEVETPILQEVYGGAAAKPFVTHHNTLKTDLYLRIATELHLKRLIIGGFEGVYEIGRLFRNEGMSPKHNPEFTTIEIYVAYQDMNFMMELTENCIKHLINIVQNKLILEYGNHILNFEKPWTKISMIESIKQVKIKDAEFISSFSEIIEMSKQYHNIADDKIRNEAKIKAYDLTLKLAKKFNLKIPPHYNSIGHLINLFFEEFVEETLIQPTFITDYPIEISPLAKLKKDSKEFTDRFELFIGGREYANAYSELNDPFQQYERFAQQMKEKDSGNDEATEMDLDFVEALEYGMPPTGGLGIGIDRLVMLITGQDSIKDVLLFPHMKPRSNK
ncbi:lysine--tRNA ligase [Spiroplasma endosymbiont of Virgichneumon dumeticola]|uniref:lysine--tRNA ligase n=1 Tax=Spiroplasma endosymbiont of Virgichneumon dumeticola TaxID=3139323 RepID=UPI0035C9185A